MFDLDFPAIDDLSQSLMLVLVHSIWQIMILAIGIAVLLRTLPARRSKLRYLITTCSLPIAVLVLLATWSVVRLETRPATRLGQPAFAGSVWSPHGAVWSPHGAVRSQNSAAQPVGVTPASAPLGSASEATLAPTLSTLPLSRWIVAIWFLGCGVMLFRAFRGLTEVRILLKESPPTAGESIELGKLNSYLKDICKSLGLRCAVSLQRCSNIASPAVVGIFWPVILIPASMLTGNTLTAQEWRIILAHELAHIRRLDGLVNLIQLLIESLLFFNPGIWWLSRQIRVEREVCCDALAARITGGGPLQVARTLLSVTETMQQTKSSISMLALPFFDRGQSGSLQDRVNRLADPDHAPRGRSGWVGLTWLGLTMSVVMLSGAVFVAQQGTDVAIRSAAALLSPQERIDKLVQIQGESTGVYAPAARGDDGNAPELNADGKVVVHIVVRTADGSPIPRGVHVIASLRRPRESATIAVAHESGSVPRLELDRAFKTGRLKLAASARGFAPVVSPVITLRPGVSVPAVELVLTKGVQRSVRVEDENGDPIHSVQVNVQGMLSDSGMRAGLHYSDATSEVRSGELSLQHAAADIQYQLTIHSPGWEYQQERMSIKPDGTSVWRIHRARPTLLKIVDDKTSQPIAGARVIVTGWSGVSDTGSLSPRMGDPRESGSYQQKWTFGRSSELGVAPVDMLNHKYRYLLCVRAEGYQPEFVQPVRPGSDDSVIRLKEAIVFAGRVAGDLSSLPRRKKDGQIARQLSYRNDLQFSGNRYSGQLDVALDADGRFQIDNLVPGEIQFSLPSGVIRFPSNTSRSGIVLDAAVAASPSGSSAMREIVLRLGGLGAEANVRGSLEFQWQQNNRWERKIVPLKDRAASLSLPIGTWFSVSEYGLVGCVFSKQRRIEVIDGDGSQALTIPVHPAGAVHGQVVRADGSPATNAGITVLEIERSPLGPVDANPAVRGDQDRFFRTLPFGGRYAILAREFNADHAVWAVSDSFVIDEDNPIQEIKLRLGAGEPTSVRVLSPDGRPVPNTAVTLSIGHTVSSHSYGRSISALTGDDGFADFGSVQRRGPSGDAEQKISAAVKPSRAFAGWQGFLDGDKSSSTVAVQPGFSATGVVIDVKTDKPIGNVKVTAFPADFRLTDYHEHIHTQTDTHGRFQLHGLQKIRYRISVPSTAPAEAVVIRNPDGSTKYSYPTPPQEQIILGGSDKVHRIQVQSLVPR